MSAVFDAQFRTLRDAFLADGVDVRVAYRPDGEVDYLYQAGRILVRPAALDGEGPLEVLNRVDALRGIDLAPENDRTPEGVLVLSTERLAKGRLTVPEALDELDHYLSGRDPGGQSPSGKAPGTPVASPAHIFHITPARSCPAVEPAVPSGYPVRPWPEVVKPRVPGRPVRVGVSDTGFIAQAAVDHDWLTGVTGDPDRVGPLLQTGRRLIPEYAGHGTFIAGVVRSRAPESTIVVGNHFPTSGALMEYDVIARLERLVTDLDPHIVSLSAGSYTRNEWEPLSFADFHTRHPDVTLVAAAGNDATDRPFYPAAFDWVIGVGALATDQRHRAWFSNYGPWVDVYALGEGMVNAYATGTYEYAEPPRRPAAQDFEGMARWDGTSFATPLVAGLIAARLAADPGATPAQAAAAVLATATTLSGVGPALTV